MATRTESLEPGTLGKHGPGPRHRPYEVAGAKKHQHRLQPRRLSPGVQGHSIKLQQLTNGPCYTLHSVTAALSARSDSDSEPARRAGDGAGSGSEPESSSSRRDLDLLRLLPPARLVDI